MNSLPPNRWSAEDFVELEQLIAGAREFVIPSEGFKARVVDSAAAIDHGQLHWAKLKTLFLLAFVAWFLFAIIYLIVSFNNRSTSQTSGNATHSFKLLELYE
ncbi:MAG: hypothetical protein U0930_20880 [Pirellulales bacterium]